MDAKAAPLSELAESYCTFENDGEPLSRTEFFMAVAELMRLRSEDPFLQVGCCIVDPENRAVRYLLVKIFVIWVTILFALEVIFIFILGYLYVFCLFTLRSFIMASFHRSWALVGTASLKVKMKTNLFGETAMKLRETLARIISYMQRRPPCIPYQRYLFGMR